MLFAILKNHFVAYIVTYSVAVPLIVALWYYIYVLKPYAKFPSCRFEYLIPYWILLRRPITVEIFRKAVEVTKKYEAEGIVVAWIFKPICCVFREDIVKLIVQGTSTTNRPSFYKFMEFSLGDGLLTSSGDVWMRQKKSISPAFHIKALETYVSVINNHAKDLVQKFSEKKNEPIDLYYMLADCTLGLLYESSLGVREGDTKGVVKTIKRIRKISEFIIHRIFSPWLHFNCALYIFPYAKKVLRTDAKNKRTYRQMLEHIKESVSNRIKSQAEIEDDDGMISDTKPKSFGEILVEDHLKLPDGSMNDLADKISVLIAAGFSTSAHTLMWCFFSLGHHQDIQERLYEEIATVSNESVDYRDLEDLIYLDCVIKETLRFYSVIPIFGRRLKEDVQIGKTFIPKNTDVVVLSHALHRNKSIYPDPDKFNPDRFLDADSKINPWNYIPFAEGNRPCPGKKFALLSIKIIMIQVLRNFKIVSLDHAEDIEFEWTIVLTSKNKPRMKLIPRLEC